MSPATKRASIITSITARSVTKWLAMIVYALFFATTASRVIALTVHLSASVHHVSAIDAMTVA